MIKSKKCDTLYAELRFRRLKKVQRGTRKANCDYFTSIFSSDDHSQVGNEVSNCFSTLFKHKEMTFMELPL